MSDWHVLGLDGDPTPGDPDRTADLAGKLLHQAELADRNRTRLDAVARGGGDLHMQGDYAPKFIEVLSELPGELGKLSSAYRGAGEAVRSFASDLRQEKARAGTALRQGTDAAARYDGALREIRSLLPSGKELVVSPMLGVEASVEQATEGLDEGTRSQARTAARRAGLAERDKAAARRLADQAARLRGEAEGRAVDGINRALDHSGIKNKSWWQKAWDVVSWPFQSWDNFVKFCRGVAFVVGIVALFISGPVGWALVGVALVAGAVAFGDTLVKFTQGKASLADLALDALGLIPGSAGAIRLAGLGTRLAEAGPRLLAMARDLPETGRLVLTGLRGTKTAIADSLRGSLESMRTFARDGLSRFVRGDPVDMATGEMLLTQGPDVEIRGVLPFTLQRTYRSFGRTGRWFGGPWSSTLDHRLEVDALGVCYAADEGVLLAYPFPREGEEALPQEGPRRPLTRTPEGFEIVEPATGRTYHFPIPRPATEISAGGGNGAGDANLFGATLPLGAITDRNGNRIELDHDADGALTAVRHSGGWRLDVDTRRGRIAEIRLRMPPGERDLVLVRYTYDEAGVLTQVINSSGRPLRFDYDDRGRMQQWTDRNGMAYRYAYDDLDRCVEGSGTGGFLDRRFAYDLEGRATTEVDSLGHATTYRFNDLLQMEGVTDALGGQTHYEWDRYDRRLAETDPLGRTTRFAYDEAGNLTEITRPDGSASAVSYNDLRLPVTVTGPDGGVWQRDYDERGNLVGVTDPTGATTTYAYDERGRLRSETDALGRRREVETDEAGRLVSVTDPAGATTRFARDPLGRVVTITDALGGATRMSWNVEGGLVSRTRPDGATERWAFDAEGNPVEHANPLGRRSRIEHGPFDMPIAQIALDGARTTIARDTELRPVEITNPQGLVWRYEYDAVGNLVRETDFNGRVLTYAYDAAGQLVEQTNGAGEVARFTPDLLGNVVEQTSGAAVSRFSYDPLGRLTRATNDDCDLTLERDPLGRVLAETCNGRTVASAYDLLGRRLERRTPSGAVSAWAWGAGDQPVKLQVASGGNSRSLRFVHDPLGRETERRLDEGVAISQTWDAGHRLRSQALVGAAPDLAGGEQTLQRRTYAYRADGYATGIDDLLSGERRLDLDPVGRIKEVTGPGRPGELEAWLERYAYDPAGNVTSASWPTPSHTAPRSPHAGSAHLSFPHEDTGSPGSERLPAGPERPSSPHGDAASGLGSERRPGDDLVRPELEDAGEQAGPGDIDARGDREYTGTLLRRAGRVRFEHDVQGRVVLRQEKRLSAKPRTWRYTWDAEDRLTSVAGPDGEQWRYRYDPLGRRIAKERVAGDGARVAERWDFVWDGVVLAEQVHQSFDDASAVDPGDPEHGSMAALSYSPSEAGLEGSARASGTERSPAPDLRAGLDSGDAASAPYSGDRCTTWDWEPGSFRPVAQTRRSLRTVSQEAIDEQFHLIVVDLAGTPTELVSPEGTVDWQPRRTVWGVPVSTAEEPWEVDCPLRFPGQYFDAETQSHYNFFRAYDPSAARFCSADPLGLAGGLTTHAYVVNPNHWVDPLGLSPYSAAELIGQLPKELFHPLKCVEAADAMVDKLRSAGIAGERLHIQAKGGADFIVNDLVGSAAITENGVHHAVRVGDTIFDNFFQGGKPADNYLGSLFAPFGIKITPEVF